MRLTAARHGLVRLRRDDVEVAEGVSDNSPFGKRLSRDKDVMTVIDEAPTTMDRRDVRIDRAYSVDEHWPLL